MKRIAAH
jgi:hypothetical protein